MTQLGRIIMRTTALAIFVLTEALTLFSHQSANDVAFWLAISLVVGMCLGAVVAAFVDQRIEKRAEENALRDELRGLARVYDREAA